MRFLTKNLIRCVAMKWISLIAPERIDTSEVRASVTYIPDPEVIQVHPSVYVNARQVKVS